MNFSLCSRVIIRSGLANFISDRLELITILRTSAATLLASARVNFVSFSRAVVLESPRRLRVSLAVLAVSCICCASVSTSFASNKLVATNCALVDSSIAARSLNLAANAFAWPASFSALPAVTRASPASLLSRAASRSEILFAALSPRNSIANPTTTINQPIFSIWSFRACSFLGNFLKCSTPSIITPIITKTNPMAANIPQILSHKASEELINNYAWWREMRMIGTLVALVAMFFIWFVKRFKKQFDIFKMRAIFQSFWVRKLIGKLGVPYNRRLRVQGSPHPNDYDAGLSLATAESNTFHIQPDLPSGERRIAA